MIELNPAFWISHEEKNVLHGVYDGRAVSVATDGAAPIELLVDLHWRNRPIGAADIFGVLKTARANIFERLLGVGTAESAMAGRNDRILVEICHIMCGAPRHCAAAAAECRDRVVQEALVKLMIHWAQHVGTWRAIAELISGEAIERLWPLPSTSALQLAMEELGAKNPLAYAATAQLFATPGVEAASDALEFALCSLASNRRAVRTEIVAWSRSIRSAETSYASVDELRAAGHPYAGDLLRLASERLAPTLWPDLCQCCDELRIIDDHLSMFVSGVETFYAERSEPWPRLRIDWLRQ
jgi:hypothetical protein